MPVQYPVAYNPRTKLENDISFSSQNLVLTHYEPKVPSQEGNAIKNGDSFTDIVTKLESKIKDLNNRLTSVETKSDITAENVEILNYVSKVPSQENNQIASGDNVKEGIRKLESRVADLNNKSENFAANYIDRSTTLAEITDRIAAAIKEFVPSTEINNRIEERIKQVSTEIIEKSGLIETINTKIVEAAENIPTRDEIESLIDSNVTNKLGDVPTNSELQNKLDITLDSYYTKPEANNVIDSKISDALSDYPDNAEVGARISAKINDLINSAPQSLDTLREIANALNNDPDFSVTITNLINGKLGKTETAVNSQKVNGLTVQTAVPAGAVFTDTTYEVFKRSGSGAKEGLVPAPSKTLGSVKYLREDCTWVEPIKVDFLGSI